MPISINDQVAHPNLMWPTPSTRALSNGQGTRERFTNSSERSTEDVADTERKGLEGLNKQSTTISGKDERIYTWNENSRDQANPSTKTGGSLNPTWVECSWDTRQGTQT